MLSVHSTLLQFSVKLINITYCLINTVYIRLYKKKTSNELWIRRKPNIYFFTTFASEHFMLEDGEILIRLMSNMMSLSF